MLPIDLSWPPAALLGGTIKACTDEAPAEDAWFRFVRFPKRANGAADNASPPRCHLPESHP